MTGEPNRLALVPRDLGPLTFVTELTPLPLVDPTTAARFLDIARHTLACYRHLDNGPPYYKFGQRIRYARQDLLHWRNGSKAPTSFPREESEAEGMLLVSPIIAARFLTVTPVCLHNYRVGGVAPKYLRYSNRIHYPVHELRAWAEGCRHAGSGGIRRVNQISRKRPPDRG